MAFAGAFAVVNYLAVAVLLAVGLYVVVDDANLVKKVVGLNVFQTAIFLFLVTAGFRADGRPPLVGEAGPYANPLPQVLVLTAIVVGVSVTAVALALIVRVYREYGTLREDVLRETLAEERGADEAADPASRSGAPDTEPEVTDD